jgi:hypothetical protein
MVVNTTLCDTHHSGAKQKMQPFIIPRKILASRISLVSTGNPALNHSIRAKSDTQQKQKSVGTSKSQFMFAGHSSWHSLVHTIFLY